MRAPLWVGLLLWVGCASEPEASRYVNTFDFLGLKGGEVEGWKANWHFAHASDRVFWTNDLAAGDSLVVTPAFEDTQPAAVVLTELWYRWPNPWVQPVYEPVGPDGQRNGDHAVFGVGAKSTFYSPFWQAFWMHEPAGSSGDPYRSTTQVLDAKLELVEGPKVLCPLVPDGLQLAGPVGAQPRHPFTGKLLRPRGTYAGWLDHQRVDWFDADANTFKASASGRVSEGKVYRFIAEADEPEEAEPLALPMVLPKNSAQTSLFREQRVVLPDDAVVFDVAASPSHDLDQTRLPAAMGVSVDAAIPAEVADRYRGRVALDRGRCFSDAAQFPQGCRWLDSESAILALPASSVTATETLVTLVTLVVGDVEQ